MGDLSKGTGISAQRDIGEQGISDGSGISHIPVGDALLLEGGFSFVLLEDDDKLLLG